MTNNTFFIVSRLTVMRRANCFYSFLNLVQKNVDKYFVYVFQASPNAQPS